MTIKRVGFACILSESHPTKGIVSIPETRIGTTTISWLNRQTRSVAEEKLWDLMVANIAAIKNLVTRVGELDEGLRMVRIGSDVLPAYTHDAWSHYWQLPDVRQYLERHLADVGSIARERDVRLSMHPGQFVVLASDNPNIVNNSIAEFEYHVDVLRYMGYGKTFQDAKCNIHVSGKRGPVGMREAYARLSPEARNVITVENEENTWGLDDCLSLSDIIPTVLDLHHYWVREGSYMDPQDARITRIIDSWKSIRPTMHYSLSREDVLVGHDCHVLPQMAALMESGHKKQKLRAHSDFMWNKASNDLARAHWSWADCMVESKAKNLASFKLYDEWTK
jgi:UV DNA damage repair endonuclease